MIRRFPLVAISAALAILACSTDKVAQAGGDDMGNFVRATLLDSAGTPLEGRVHAFSDVDTVSTELDAGGILTLPARHRSWLVVRSPTGSAYVLHAPPDSGALRAMRLGTPRPLVGWLRRTATLRIAGVGTTACTGGLFRFAAVPPGSMRLEAWSDSFSASAPLAMAEFGASPAPVDSFVVAPITISGTGFVTAERDDSATCDALCRSLWTGANVHAETYRNPPASVDTFRLAAFSAAIPDTSGIVSVDSIRDLGNWLLLWVRMRDASAPPRFHRAPGDTVPGNSTPHVLILGAGAIVDTTLLPGADTSRFRRIALPRTDGSVFADSLVVRHRSILAIAPANRSATRDTCDAEDQSRARPCGDSPGWYYTP